MCFLWLKQLNKRSEPGFGGEGKPDDISEGETRWSEDNNNESEKWFVF